MKTLSIIMPVYNEAKNLKIIIPKVLKADVGGLERELIIAEGGSTDGSDKIVDEFKKNKSVSVYHMKKYCGKGFKVRYGIRKAKGDIILIQDADLEYDVNDYKELLEPIIKGKTEFVLGSRHLGAGTWKTRKFAREPIKGFIVNLCARGLDVIFNMLNSVWLTDPQTMYKVFTKDSIKGIEFNADHFDFDWEIVTKLIKKGYKPLEIPINYKSRSTSEGKKIKFIKDGFRNLWSIMRYRFFD